MWTTVFVMAAIAVVTAVWLLTRRQPALRPSEVASILRSLLDGSIDDDEWDQFTSMNIDDPRLESIRDRCAELIVEGTATLGESSVEPERLSPYARRKIKSLLDECEQLRRK